MRTVDVFWKMRLEAIVFLAGIGKIVQAAGRNRHLDPKESTKPCLVPLRITLAESDLKWAVPVTIRTPMNEKRYKI